MHKSLVPRHLLVSHHIIYLLFISYLFHFLFSLYLFLCILSFWDNWDTLVNLRLFFLVLIWRRIWWGLFLILFWRWRRKLRFFFYRWRSFLTILILLFLSLGRWLRFLTRRWIESDYLTSIILKNAQRFLCRNFFLVFFFLFLLWWVNQLYFYLGLYLNLWYLYFFVFLIFIWYCFRFLNILFFLRPFNLFVRMNNFLSF